ncbi:LPXTG cell wall anchor domain-containing protein [Roseicyclus mahoneyensis]|uniref:LPXTG-motif cell wall-anchored protein n=1 Tax=Roseicyclus mahoneyensis TaxID=164332 RepID=A0A316GHA4_9RHOB|nr:LPXTG cell wall anchor domain-containing protein [Roseicyclus mahoneyensis]PWK60453.1 LPXTG-motif cell wall-anchored protein [Roseicyclus mahoneyensis]
MDLVDTAIHELSAALADLDHAALTPLLAGAGVIALGLWLLARRRKANRA